MAADLQATPSYAAPTSIVQGVSSITKTMADMKTEHDHGGKSSELQAGQGLPKHNEVERQRCVHATQLHIPYMSMLAGSHQQTLPFDNTQHRMLVHQNSDFRFGPETFQQPAFGEQTGEYACGKAGHEGRSPPPWSAAWHSGAHAPTGPRR